MISFLETLEFHGSELIIQMNDSCSSGIEILSKLTSSTTLIHKFVTLNLLKFHFD